MATANPPATPPTPSPREVKKQLTKLKQELIVAIKESCGPFDPEVTRLLEAAKDIPGGRDAAEALLRKLYVDYLDSPHALLRRILWWVRLGVFTFLFMAICSTLPIWYPYLARTSFMAWIYEHVFYSSAQVAVRQRYFFNPLGKETLDALNSLRRPHRLAVDRTIVNPVIGTTYRDNFHTIVFDHTGRRVGGVQVMFSVGDNDDVTLGNEANSRQVILEADEEGVVSPPPLTVNAGQKEKPFTLSVKVLGYPGIEKSFKLTPIVPPIVLIDENGNPISENQTISVKAEGTLKVTAKFLGTVTNPEMAMALQIDEKPDKILTQAPAVKGVVTLTVENIPIAMNGAKLKIVQLTPNSPTPKPVTFTLEVTN